MNDRRRIRRAVLIGWLAAGVAMVGWSFFDEIKIFDNRTNKSTTIMFYMNGDNDLTDEVLSAVDRLETVGAFPGINLAVLVDGHPDGVSRFGEDWIGTRLLHIRSDPHPAVINSEVLADWGEQDLGDPRTLTRFVRTVRCLFPADRYIFCAFAHGKGVIDTGRLSRPTDAKSLCMSPDATSGTIMPLAAFQSALKQGLDGDRFTLTVLCTCLSGMVEIAYSLGGITDYLVASQDEVRLVNIPPGAHQLRGIAFDDWLRRLIADPTLSDIELGRSIINGFIAPYRRSIRTAGPGGQRTLGPFPAGAALIDCRAARNLTVSLDHLALALIDDLQHSDTVLPTLAALQAALTGAPRFKSFLNLEYYDLLGWLQALQRNAGGADIRRLCRRSADILQNEVIRYERHTPVCGLGGMSIYFSHHLVPENIHSTHRRLYGRTRFGRDTHWDELINTFRVQMRLHRPELLLDLCRSAYRRGDLASFRRWSRQTAHVLGRRVQEDRFDTAEAFIRFLNRVDPVSLTPPLIEDLHAWFDQGTPSPRTEGLFHGVERLRIRQNAPSAEKHPPGLPAHRQ